MHYTDNPQWKRPDHNYVASPGGGWVGWPKDSRIEVYGTPWTWRLKYWILSWFKSK